MADRFQIEYSEEAFADLKALRKYDQQMIVDAIAVQPSTLGWNQPRKVAAESRRWHSRSGVSFGFAWAIWGVL
jgi:hypothetical protein